MVSRSRKEERQRLTAQIEEWNSNRLDLFALSQPNEDLEFFGVMRFFYQDEGEKVSTKCVRVSSTASTKDVMAILIEKFRPDLRMLSRPNYALYEVHVNGEERQLRDPERPLLVQLNWGKDDREGRFLLKRETDKTMLVDCTSTAANQIAGEGNGSFKRKLSKREKKELKKKEKEQKVKGKENDSGIAEKLYNELPESSFTRSISNPELVMRKRRQLKLEKKLQQIRSNDGGPDAGGTLKIYGSAVNPDVPYKTLLLALTDTVAHVVKETLEKYGIEKEDPDKFCLIQVMIPPDGPDFGKDPRERILDDDECPLAILLQHPPSKGTIMFQLRPRTADMPKKSKKNPALESPFRDDKLASQVPSQQYQQHMPYLLQISPDGGGEPYSQKKHILSSNSTEIGRDRKSLNPKVPHIQLATQDILPRHCVITNSQGVVTVTPVSKEALVFINGARVFETTVLRHGMVVQFGKMHQFRFMDGPDNELKGHPTVSSEAVYTRVGPREKASKDYETTFDVDGRVETVRNQDRAQQQMFAPDPRFGPPGYEADLLPASLTVQDEVEDKFLAAVINDDKSSSMQFRMVPTYAVYMLVRSRTMHLNHPDLSPDKYSWLISSVTSKIAHLVYQKIRESKMNPSLLSFWMSNASEMLNFFKRDVDITPYCLASQNLLAEAVQLAFTFLTDYMQSELDQTMPAFLNPQDESEQNVDVRYQHGNPTISDVLQVLSSAMTVLRRCRVNAALTIQLFSQLFHFINMWIFNRLLLQPQLRLCTRPWGQILSQRLGRVQDWAEQQGLELAAECHLGKVLQATFVLSSPKTLSDVGIILEKCENLNSLQLHQLFANYILSPGEPPLRTDVIEQLIVRAQNTVDKMLQNEGIDLNIDEPVSLHLPFLLPDDGYSCEFVKGVPSSLTEFLQPFVQKGLCRFIENRSAHGTWMIYMTNQEDMHTYQNLKPQQSSSESKMSDVQAEQDVLIINFSKVKNSLGLSIIAAKGEGQKEKSIYVKSVVPGGGAAKDGRIQAGDQLLEVDGKSLLGVSQEKAAEMMTQTGQVVTLKVAKQGAFRHGLVALLNQTQQPPAGPNLGPNKQIKGLGGDGEKLLPTNTRPLSSDFRNSPKPLNQQLEAKSTPVLTDTRFREQVVTGEVDSYADSYRSSPQQQQPVAPSQMKAPNMRHTSSQPDLINDRAEPKQANHSGVAPFYQTGQAEASRYGYASVMHMKGAASSPNIPADSQKGFPKSEEGEHQRILEWQKRNQIMMEREQWDQKRPNASTLDDKGGTAGTRGRAMPMDDERGWKSEPLDITKPPSRPALPLSYQPLQPPSKKGPGYATQMLFPGKTVSQTSVKDGTLAQGYQAHLQPGYGSGKPTSYSNIQNQLGNAVFSSQGEGQQMGQSFAPVQSRNYSGNNPSLGASLTGSSIVPQDYHPGSSSQVTDVSRMNLIPRNRTPDPDFPPPPSDMNLAQFGVQVVGDMSSKPSAYRQSTSAATGLMAPYSRDESGSNRLSVESGRLHESNAQMNQPRTSHGYSEKVGASEVTKSAYGLGNESYQVQSWQNSTNELSSGYGVSMPPPVSKKPPPVAAKPKVGTAPSTSVSLMIMSSDSKPYSTSPWEEKDFRDQRMDEELQKKRLEEIKRLQNRPYLSREEQSKLQRLLMEAEFDRRAEEAIEDKDSEEDAMEINTAQINPSLISHMKNDFGNVNLHQQEPTYARVDKQHVLSDNRKRSTSEPQQRVLNSISGFGDRKPEQPRPIEPPTGKTQSPDFYTKHNPPGPPPSNWSYEMSNQDTRALVPGQLRYSGDDKKLATDDYPSIEYSRQIGLSQEMETNRPKLMPPRYQMELSYGQQDYSGPPGKPDGESFNTSLDSGQSNFGHQQLRPGTVSVLKQPDSQAGNVKKSVTFSENIGVTEYTINRSYGSTSSESSYPQSPEQMSTGAKMSSDQPPPASYMAPPAPVRPAYVASVQPNYFQQLRNTDPAYPRMPYAAEPQYPYGVGHHTDSTHTAAFKSQAFEQTNTQGSDLYPSEPHYLNQSGGYIGYQGNSSYPFSKDPMYSKQQPPVRDNMNEPIPNTAYVSVQSPASVIGAQEVYRDTRDRTVATGLVPNMNSHRQTPDRISFRDKMSMYSSEVGE